jgi:hypothetical protein
MEVPRYWRTNQQRYQLMGSICSNCEEPSFPSREVCPHCDGASGTQYAFRDEALPYSNILMSENFPVENPPEQQSIEVKINENRGMIFQSASATT